MMRPAAVLLWLTAVLSVGLPGAAPHARGQEAGKAEIVGVRAGLAGCYKPGCWTPVEVTLRGAGRASGGQLVLIVPDGDGIPSAVSVPLPSPTPHPATDETPVLLFARFGRVRSELAVELRNGQDLVDRKVFKPGQTPGYRPALSSDQELIVTVGRAPLGVDEAVRMLGQRPDRRTVVVRLEHFRELPTRWYGYEGVDTVLLSTSDPAVYADLEPTGLETAALDHWIAALDERIVALDEWVRNGGRLVLSVGEKSQEVFTPDPETLLARFRVDRSEKIPADPLQQLALSRLEPFVPGRLKEVVPLRPTMVNAWEIYCGSSVRIPATRRETLVPHLGDVRGKVEAASGRLPLVIRGARGFGQVVFLAADLDQPPLADWEDRKLLIGKLLGYPATPIDQTDEGTAVMHYGFTDLAGQLRSALDQFPAVSLVPFAAVVVLIVLYILAIGPGDYFFLRKVVRRVQLTWITFPLIAVAFSVLAYALAHRLKGDQLRVNQAVLVDVDLSSGRVRGTSWATVFSPRTARYDFSFQPRLPGGRPAPQAATLTAWLGLPGDALGGMDPSTAETTVWKDPCEFSRSLDTLRHVPIPIWSTKSLTGRWTTEWAPPLESELADDDSLLRGTITNRLGFPLADCLVAYGMHAYKIDNLQPGETIQVGPELRPRELKSLLTGRQFVRDEEKDNYRPQATPYDQESVDVGYVLRAMMFYTDAGGRGYTGLANCYQGFVDFSHLLTTNRAVLIARAATHPDDAACRGADLMCNGEPVPESQVQHETVYRFVFPVESRE
jgi:hypothetical protein